jgi:hypothetical protein
MSPSAPLPPRASRHLDQARCNHALFQRLLSSGQDLDWALTALYYTAVHLIEAYGASLGRPLFGTHPRREGFIAVELPTALCGYMTLHNWANGTKYKLMYPDARFVQDAHDREFEDVRKALANKGITL